MTYKNAQQTLCILLLAVSCTTPNPNRRRPPGDASADGAVDGDNDGPPLCTANQPLRCEAGSLVRCNGNGTAELKESCPLGCVAADLRCAELVPSNGLATYLGMAAGQPDLNLGDSATINTDTGEVRIGGVPIVAYSAAVSQAGGPTIRVFAVHSLIAKNVDVVGNHALAIVSNGDVEISGVFAAPSKGSARGAGAYGCGLGLGQPEIPGPPDSGLAGGGGGGGFGGPGGSGGSATSSRGRVSGGNGGLVNGNESLEPLRGGCDGGGSGRGGGGGALQFVSRSRIAVTGTIAASGGGGNGSGSSGGGGGSGGGILLEAPIVEISGKVAANGGGGSGCGVPSDGGYEAIPAPGTPACQRTMFLTFNYGAGGAGGAGPFGAVGGEWVTMEALVIAGYGGGGVGRIRINTASGDFSATGIVSPIASKGTIVTR